MKPVDLDIDDYYQAVAVFHGESDRAAAVLAGSFAESYLAKYLRSFMVEDAPVNELFGGFGPFAEFMQRVETAYAFGFVSKKQRSDLKLIGKIRNHFAHHPLDAGFDKQPVSNWCTNLSTAGIYPLPDQPADTRNDNRLRFLIAVSTCVAAWHNSMLEREKKNAPNK